MASSRASSSSTSPAAASSSFDTLLADLYQVVAEILLLRRPRVHTAATDNVSARVEPPPDLVTSTLVPDPCPFCTTGSLMKAQRLVR